MGSKSAIAVLVLLMIVGGEHGNAMPVRCGLSLGSMNGMKGGSPPGGIHPSDTTLYTKVGKN